MGDIIGIDELNGYRNKIDEIKKAVDKTSKEILVHQTNLKNLQDQREKLKKECEDIVGVPMSEASAVLEDYSNKLKEAMGLVENIDFDNLSNITIAELEDIRVKWREIFNGDNDK